MPPPAFSLCWPGQNIQLKGSELATSWACFHEIAGICSSIQELELVGWLVVAHSCHSLACIEIQKKFQKNTRKNFPLFFAGSALITAPPPGPADGGPITAPGGVYLGGV